MGVPTFDPGDRVAIRAGAFAGCTGQVISAAEAANRWPDQPPAAGVSAGRAYWVVVSIFGRAVPLVMESGQLARA